MVHIPEQAVIAETGKSVPVEDIVIGSRIIVCAGEKIALDGDVVKGQASVDESSITGESMPIEKGPGDKTYSGTIVQNGYLEVGKYIKRQKFLTNRLGKKQFLTFFHGISDVFAEISDNLKRYSYSLFLLISYKEYHKL